MTATVDTSGIHFAEALDVPVDVRFGGHRLWSMVPSRDGSHDADGTQLLVAWPAPIRERLRGVAEVTVETHLDRTVLFADTVQFGSSGEPLAFFDDAGNPLTLDKGGRFQRSFDRMDQGAIDELVDAAHRVLVDLQEQCGLEAYLCYGALLGAVRDGRMIGHDSDVDLAWLSAHQHPFDIVRESRRAERTMRRRGWRVVRLSAANFKVWVPLPNGRRAGVDVFGSFHIGDHFHITGTLRGTLDRDRIVPFGTVRLEGVEFPAPRDLDAFLTYTYGPGWRVPDPAFHFDHPAEHKRIMSQWWRGTRNRMWHWGPFYNSARAAEVPEEHSAFAEWVATRLAPGDRILEVGAGNGRDAVWFADRGHEVLAGDYSGTARNRMHQLAGAHEGTVEEVSVNLESTRSVLVHGAQVARRPGPTHLYARFVVDAVAAGARPNLWRLCSMVCRSGGHTFLEFRTAQNRGENFHFGDHVRTLPPVRRIVTEIEAAGGRVLDKVVDRGLAVLEDEDPLVCRLEVSWSGPTATRSQE